MVERTGPLRTEQTVVTADAAYFGERDRLIRRS
jgi:hypothetical protein